MDEKGGFVVSAVESAFLGGKSKDVGELWVLGRGMTFKRSVGGGERDSNEEADGGAAHGLGALLARPVFVGVAHDAGEEEEVVVEIYNGLRERKRRC